jgi:ADP-heptose:LPS heptosyltransferase
LGAHAKHGGRGAWGGAPLNLKILLVRLDGIGDALACTPLIAALRSAGHELGIALTQRNSAVFARTTFEWTHVLERNPWPGHGHAKMEAAVTSAEHIGYDLALVASEEPDAYVLAQRCAKRRVGFINGWEKPLKSLAVRRLLDCAIVRPASAKRAREHEVVTLFRLGEGLHDEAVPARDAVRLSGLVVDGANSRGANAPIAMQLGPKWTAMGIERSRLGEIVRELRALAPVRLLVSGEEAGEIRALREFLDDAETIDATVFDGEEGMRAWKRAIAEARVLVTMDTGAAHVAGMTGTPCVDLFADVPWVRAEIVRWEPWAAPHACLVAGRDAPITAAVRDLCARF